MMYGYYPAFGFFDFIWHALAIVFVIWVIVMIIRGGRGPGWRHWNRMHMYDMWQSHSAMNILNERFAKGEISKEEYEERKKTLMNS